MSSKKTSTITFRIGREYEQVLREEAEAKRVSLNTLANQIFEDYRMATVHGKIWNNSHEQRCLQTYTGFSG